MAVPRIISDFCFQKVSKISIEREYATRTPYVACTMPHWFAKLLQKPGSGLYFTCKNTLPASIIDDYAKNISLSPRHAERMPRFLTLPREYFRF